MSIGNILGTATIEYDDGAKFDMEAGSYLNIPAHQRHKVTRTDASIETIWLAIHYDV